MWNGGTTILGNPPTMHLPIHRHFISHDCGHLAPDRIALAFFTESISWRFGEKWDDEKHLSDLWIKGVSIYRHLTTHSCTLTPNPLFLLGRPLVNPLEKSWSLPKIDVCCTLSYQDPILFRGLPRVFLGGNLNHFYSTNLKLSKIECHADLWESHAILSEVPTKDRSDVTKFHW